MEWLADNKKKYWQVFDWYEIIYIYVEFFFYNKFFDVKDWEVDVEFCCYVMKKNFKLFCFLLFCCKVSKYDYFMFICEGWGNKIEGVFWKKGIYFWEVWIEGEKVVIKYFYVEEVGWEVLFGENFYLEVQFLKLYEGLYDDVIEDECFYYEMFSSEEIWYIYVEIVLQNLFWEKFWYCELFMKFYNDVCELKGQVVCF